MTVLETDRAETAEPRVPVPGPPARRSRRPHPDLRWGTITVLAVLVAAAIPLLFFHRYYFIDDTESGAFGVWYKLGTNLRHGEIQLFDPHAWMSGNYVAEGQWGFFNPIVLLIGLGASFTTNAVAFCSALKMALLALAALGVFRLLRSYGADAPFSAVAGVAAPLAGFTLYMDAQSWVTGLMVWVALPWFWKSARAVAAGRNPVGALVWGYLMITVGYVYGAIYAVVVLVAIGIELLLRRRWAGAVRIVALGVFCGLVTLTVYLPGVLTAPVTERSNQTIFNDAFMTVPLTGIVSGVQPNALPFMPGFWGSFSPAPVLYIAWFLPMLAFVDGRRARVLLRRRLDLVIALVLFAALVLAPSQIGPLRFPGRITPTLALSVIVLVGLLLSRARVTRRRRGRLAVASGVTVFSAYLAWAQTPATNHTVVFDTVVVLVAQFVFWRLSTRPDRVGTDPVPRPGRLAARATSVIAVGMIAVSVGFVYVQHHASPRAGLNVYGMPSNPADYREQAAGAVNDGIVVGEGHSSYPPPAILEELVLGNAWYLNPHSMQNTYTPVGYAAYAPLVCMNFLGETCGQLATRLFQTRPTGMTLADEMSIDTVQIIKSRVKASVWQNPPTGWSLTSNRTYTVLWTRDEPVGPAGGVLTTTGGLVVHETARSDRAVTFQVDQVPAGGGQVAFSRLDWPGYTVDGPGSIGTAMDGFLLQVDLPASAQGRSVTVEFSPPGWHLELGAWGVALAGGLVWVLAAAVLAFRRRRALRSTAAPVEPGVVA